MPVRVGGVVSLEPGEGFAKGVMELWGDESVGLGRAECGVQGRDNSRAGEVLGLVAQLKDALLVSRTV